MYNININNMTVYNGNMYNGCDQDQSSDPTIIPDNQYFIFTDLSQLQVASADPQNQERLIVAPLNMNDDNQRWASVFSMGAYNFQNVRNDNFISIKENTPNSEVVLAPDFNNPNNKWSPFILFNLFFVINLRLRSNVSSSYIKVDPNNMPQFTTVRTLTGASPLTLINPPFAQQLLSTN